MRKKSFKVVTWQIVEKFVQRLSQIDSLLDEWDSLKKKMKYPDHLTPLKHILTALSLIEEQYILWSNSKYLKFSDSFNELQKEFDKRRTLIIHYSHMINEKHGTSDLVGILSHEIDLVQMKKAYQYLHSNE